MDAILGRRATKKPSTLKKPAEEPVTKHIDKARAIAIARQLKITRIGNVCLRINSKNSVDSQKVSLTDTRVKTRKSIIEKEKGLQAAKNIGCSAVGSCIMRTNDYEGRRLNSELAAIRIEEERKFGQIVQKKKEFAHRRRKFDEEPVVSVSRRDGDEKQRVDSFQLVRPLDTIVKRRFESFLETRQRSEEKAEKNQAPVGHGSRIKSKGKSHGSRISREGQGQGQGNVHVPKQQPGEQATAIIEETAKKPPELIVTDIDTAAAAENELPTLKRSTTEEAILPTVKEISPPPAESKPNSAADNRVTVGGAQREATAAERGRPRGDERFTALASSLVPDSAHRPDYIDIQSSRFNYKSSKNSHRKPEAGFVRRRQNLAKFNSEFGPPKTPILDGYQ